MINVTVEGVSAANLGINGTDITTVSTADAASELLGIAIDLLNTSRASVGAYQNRLDSRLRTSRPPWRTRKPPAATCSTSISLRR